jgi:lysylphosphatidylglycerol synthetase-like protein (DUF2156 family)
MRSPYVAVLAVLAAVEGIALVAYGVYVGIDGIRLGTTGPASVSNIPALVSLVVILLILGAGMLLIARGWWQVKRWARSPFVLAQLIVALLGWEMAQGGVQPTYTVGMIALIVGIAGVVLAFVPPVSRSLAAED